MKKIIHWVGIAALFLIPVFPLIVANSFFFPFITGKAFYFRILVEVAFASWIILAFLDAKYRPRLNSLTVAVSLFAVVTLVADVLGVNPLRSIWSNFERMEGWLVVVHLWMFFMTATHLFGYGPEGKRWWYRWLNMTTIIATAVALYGLFQMFGWAGIHQGSSRIDASLGNAAYMAVYMLFHAFIAAYLFFTRANTVKSIDFPQWIYAILSVLFAFLLFQTATRGTILGLIGGVLLALFLYAMCGTSKEKHHRIISGGAVAAIILIGILFWFNRSAPFIQNNAVLSRLASISLQENKTQARGYIWPMALQGWQERPVFGWGQENFNYVFNAKYNPEMWPHEQWFDRAHSVFLDWLIASGAVGLLAYLALYALFIISIWKSDLSIGQKSILTGLIAGYAVHNVFVFDNLASYAFFFALLGFAGSLRGGKPIHWLGTTDTRVDVVEYIVAPVIVVILVVGAYFLNIRPLQANTRLLDSLQACANGKAETALFEEALDLNAQPANQEIREQLISCAGSVMNGQYAPATKQAFLDLTSNEVDVHITENPNDVRMYVLAGAFLNSISQYSQAETLLLEANRLSPRKQSILFQLATAMANIGKIPEALELMKAAYESAPENPQSRQAYAGILILSGKEAEAQVIFRDDPAVFESDTVIQIYISRKEFSKAIAIYRKKIAADSSNLQLRIQLVQTLEAAGLIDQAITALRAVAKDFPQHKSSVDQAIKEFQSR